MTPDAAGHSRRARWAIVAAFAGAVVGMVIGWLSAVQFAAERDDAERGERWAQHGEAQAEQKVRAAEDSLESLCEAGYRSACDQLASLPSVPPPDDPEFQELEIQEPEVQEPERQDPELPDRELQEGEVQDDERQETEDQEREVQEGEVDDPEPDDPEQQDPEVDDPDPNDPDPDDPDPDDPDPNSGLQFAADDSCNPPAGHYVADVGLTVTRGDGTVTYTVTCTTAPLPGPPGQQK